MSLHRASMLKTEDDTTSRLHAIHLFIFSADSITYVLELWIRGRRRNAQYRGPWKTPPKRLPYLSTGTSTTLTVTNRIHLRKSQTVRDEHRNKTKKGGGNKWSLLLQVGKRSTRSLRTTKCRKKCTVYTRLTATVEIASGEERGKK